MQAARTPWEKLMTIPALPIHVSARSDEVTVELGSRPGRRIVGKLSIGTSQMTLLVPGRGTQPMAPYSFQLKRWTEKAVPIIRTHPLAILHLLVTGQCDVNELFGSLTRFPPGRPGVVMDLRQPCPLLTMLGVRHAKIGFTTSTDSFNVNRA